ncbi:hypothetical protein [Dokdonia sp.]|uniref:hypothetical protein n=1 Tax=Dokdonia sp. TaxID=2024995 RepID=UPI0032656950
MKTILPSFILLMCIIGNAQEVIKDTKKKDATDTNPVFAWFEKKQLPANITNPEEVLELQLQDLTKTYRKEQAIKDKKGMPVYPTPNSENYPMPVKTVDTTKTKYLKIYPLKE